MAGGANFGASGITSQAPSQNQALLQQLGALNKSDPVRQINPAYTFTPQVQSTLNPMAQFQAFKQTGQMPAQQNSFTPWQQPATPMMQAAPVATSTRGAK